MCGYYRILMNMYWKTILTNKKKYVNSHRYGESSVRKQTDMKHFLIIHKKNIGWFIMVYRDGRHQLYMFCFC